jgi:hypothetical protein
MNECKPAFSKDLHSFIKYFQRNIYILYIKFIHKSILKTLKFQAKKADVLI